MHSKWEKCRKKHASQAAALSEKKPRVLSETGCIKLASKSSGVKFSRQIRQTGWLPLAERFRPLPLADSSLLSTPVEALGLVPGLIPPADSAEDRVCSCDGEADVGLSSLACTGCLARAVGAELADARFPSLATQSSSE